MLEALISFLFPTQCIGCRKTGKELCSECMKTIQPHQELCILCHAPSSDYVLCHKCKWSQDYTGISIAFSYSWLVKKLILALKYYHKYDISRFLAYKLAVLILCNVRLSRAIKVWKKVMISYVPSHWTRRIITKWYNQSELLAKYVAFNIGLECKQLVEKNSYTRSQASLERWKRLNNLKTAFSLCKDVKLSDYHSIVIIDDITTTWSTIQAIARCIKADYPHLQVRWAVLARSNG